MHSRASASEPTSQERKGDPFLAHSSFGEKLTFLEEGTQSRPWGWGGVVLECSGERAGEAPCGFWDNHCIPHTGAPGRDRRGHFLNAKMVALKGPSETLQPNFIPSRERELTPQEAPGLSLDPFLRLTCGGLRVAQETKPSRSLGPVRSIV